MHREWLRALIGMLIGCAVILALAAYLISRKIPMNAIERHGQEVALGIHASTHLKVAIAAFVIAVSVVAASYAFAHDTGKGWSYDWACCHDHDCSEIAASRVRTTPEGYIVDGKHFVSHADAKFAPDGRYHACFPTPEFLRCLYVPPSGS